MDERWMIVERDPAATPPTYRWAICPSRDAHPPAAAPRCQYDPDPADGTAARWVPIDPHPAGEWITAALLLHWDPDPPPLLVHDLTFRPPEPIPRLPIPPIPNRRDRGRSSDPHDQPAPPRRSGRDGAGLGTLAERAARQEPEWRRRDQRDRRDGT